MPYGPDGGDARRIVPDPQDHAHLYLGTANGWIYESHNAGDSWTRLAQIGKRDDLVLDSIVVDPQNPKHVVVGAWVVDRHDGGIFLSWDGGSTWTNQAEMRGKMVLSLAESTTDPNVMVAGTRDGVFHSSDGGLRWKLISPPDSNEIHNVQSVAIDPRDASVIYAGTWHLPWKTTDGGEHWANIKAGIIDDSDVFSIIVDPEKPQTVFASACSGIYKSLNAGEHFEKVQGIPSTARRTRRLLQDPHHLDTVFAGTTEGLYRSDDAGKSWERTTGPEIIVNDVEIDLNDPRRVLLATDRGGVMASDDGGDTFHPSNSGFSARQVTAIKRDTTHLSTLFAGVVNDKDWGGVFESDNGGQSWVQRSEGLAGRDVFSLGQAPDGTMIAGTSHGLFRLDRESRVWTRVQGAPGAVVQKESVDLILTRPPVPIGEDRVTPPVGEIVATADAALPEQGTRRPAAKKLTKAQALAAAKKQTRAKPLAAKSATGHKPAIALTHSRVFDGSVYALATADGTVLATTSVGLLSSTDDGVSWAAIGPDGSSEWRFLAAAKKNVIAASLHEVHLSSDAGVNWQQVKLPAMLTQISAVAVEPSGQMWVGGREGVFVSRDGGNTWTIPKDLYLNAISSIFYDETTDRVTITAGGNSSLVFTVLLPVMQVNFTDTGWNLRFARPVGDHIVAATLYDGIVVQPVPPKVAAASGASAARNTGSPYRRKD
jgi:photosystem II stability/assembly factor-like uncharacterized protein